MHAVARRSYADYYEGREYWDPHRHHHSVYSFPVVVEGEVVYRPYHYCGDELVVVERRPIRRGLRIELGF
jgi:hypothetical protein